MSCSSRERPEGSFAVAKAGDAAPAAKVTFLVSFLACGTTCALNLYFFQSPAHNYPTDFLTAYVHVPALQGYLFWKRKTSDPRFLELVSALEKANPAHAVKTRRHIRIICTLANVALVGMSIIVLCGYSVPAQLAAAAAAERDHVPAHHSFMYWHAVVMWPVIPPVISCYFSTCALLIFFSALAGLEAKACRECVHLFMSG